MSPLSCVVCRVWNLCDKSCEFLFTFTNWLRPTYKSKKKRNICPKFTQHVTDGPELTHQSIRTRMRQKWKKNILSSPVSTVPKECSLPCHLSCTKSIELLAAHVPLSSPPNENSDNTKIMGLKSIHLFSLGIFYGKAGRSKEQGKEGILNPGQGNLEDKNFQSVK